MKPLELKINPILPLHFEGFLFNEAEQIKRQQASKAIILHFSDKDFSYARFNLFIKNEEGYSPYRAPFGSIEYDETLDESMLSQFLNQILLVCKEERLKKLTIVLYPYCYAPNKSRILEKVFIEHGFQVKYTDLNFHISIQEGFEVNLHYSEKRKLVKSLNKNFEIKIDKGLYVSEMFQLIRETRERKGFPISMKESELANLFKEFPANYEAFTLWDSSILVACAIGVRINSNILYYFLPGDNIDYRSFSPTVLLLKRMFEYCKNQGMGILDLGIATAGGIRNEGLIRFKKNLGGTTSLKLTIEKEL